MSKEFFDALNANAAALADYVEKRNRARVAPDYWTV